MKIDIKKYDPKSYDVDAIKFDNANGNFDPNNADEYLKTNIIKASIANGQHSQARRQCAKWGYNYNDMRRGTDESARVIRNVLSALGESEEPSDTIPNTWSKANVINAIVGAVIKNGVVEVKMLRYLLNNFDANTLTDLYNDALAFSYEEVNRRAQTA